MLKFGVCRVNHATFFSILFTQGLTFKPRSRKVLIYFSITGFELKYNASAYYGNTGRGVFKREGTKLERFFPKKVNF